MRSGRSPVCRLSRRSILETGSAATSCSAGGRPPLGVTVRVSTWTISPGFPGLSPVGLRRAHFRWLRAALGAFAGGQPFATDRDGDLGLSPHRLVEARLLDGLDQFRRPSRPPQAPRPSGPRFEAALPSKPVPVEERGSRNADHLGGLSRRKALAPRQMPSIQNAAPESGGLAAFRGLRPDRPCPSARTGWETRALSSTAA